MYKGNGETKVFPLPLGEDGRVVFLVAGGRMVRAKEGESYTLRDGNVVFASAPPIGMEVAFGEEVVTAAEISPSSKTMTVIRADGTTEMVTEDPTVLLAEARGQLREAKEMLKAAVSAQDAVRIIADEQRRIGEASFSGRLARYEGLVEESVKGAAALARDDLMNVFNSKLLEIRNKHKATIEAHDAVQALLRGAKSELTALVDDAVLRMEKKCEPLMDALKEMHSLVVEAREARNAATIAAASAGVEVSKFFGERAECVLAEIRSLKAIISGEIKSVVESAQRTMNAEIEQARAHRDFAGRAAKRAEDIERKAAEMVGK